MESKETKENNVMAAVMHLQRAMKRGPANGPGHFNPEFRKGGMSGTMHQGRAPHGGHGMHRNNMTEGRLIFALSKKESMTTSELMEELDIRPSSMSELLSKLEQRGLVQRSQSEEDKRINIVSLTEKARTLGEKISEERAARMAVFTACFSEEEAAEFCRLCNKLSDHLESLKLVR